MNTLFDISPVLPPGFSYNPSFISEAEEASLLEIVSAMELANMKFHQYEAKRKVTSFGKGWSFTEQQLKAGNNIPAEFDFLVKRIADQLKIDKEQIAQFLVTEYPVGSVINWHRDAPPFETVIGVSLLSDVIFKLRPHDKEKQTRSATISLPVRRRSMYVMTGESKTDWQHCTAPAQAIRYSLTFRTLRKYE
jgi:alkylated DNA repair dioxygenase AlkB